MSSQLEQWKTQLFAEIERIAPEVFKLSDDLADNPEVGGEELGSVKKITALLEGHGLYTEKSFAGLPTAFKAEVAGSGDDSEVKIALLAEYDALPDLGHACGHNVSGAISILAGLALSKVTDAVRGSLYIIGTPDEEGDGGKITMSELGIFDGYTLAMMVHLDNKNRVNSRLMALDGLEFIFKGKSSHAAAAPWEGRNALNGVQLMFHAVDMLRQHVKPDVRMHGIVDEGGYVCNIVPEKAVGHIFIRSEDRAYLDDVQKMVLDCAKGAALATQTEVEVNTLCPSLSDLKPNRAAEEVIRQCFKELDIPNQTDGKAFGSSDIGAMSYRCPTLHPTLALTQEDIKIHTREFLKLVKGETAHKVILNGARILALACLRVFNNPELAEKIKQEFQHS